MPYWEEPKYNEPTEVDDADDVHLPSTMHHMQAKAELDLLVQAGSLTDAEAQRAMNIWRARKELADEDMVTAAISVLEENGLIDEDEAGDLRERAPG